MIKYQEKNYFLQVIILNNFDVSPTFHKFHIKENGVERFGNSPAGNFGFTWLEFRKAHELLV